MGLLWDQQMCKKTGAFLQNWRVERELTQAEIASKLGYSSSQFVSNWERGTSMPPHKDILKICKAYELSPKVFYNFLKVETDRVLRSLLRI